MKNTSKEILRLLIPQFVYNYAFKKRNAQLLKKWKEKGCPSPPPHIVKENIVGEYQQKYSYSTFIETGTLRGNMIQAQKKRFQKVISIEVNNYLYNKAKLRFKKDKNVNIIHGDSSKVLPKILDTIQKPIIFYLDAHFVEGISEKGSKICPILDELDVILSNKLLKHVILIDDAHDFRGKNGYPTIEKLTEFIQNKNSNYTISVKDDIIRCEI